MGGWRPNTRNKAPPRQVFRYKAVVIPQIGNKYIVVRDSVSKDITFVVGGCKKSETSAATCASRELYEETHGIVDVELNNDMIRFTFRNTGRSRAELAKDKRENVFVTMIYNVFIVPFGKYVGGFDNVKKKFNAKTEGLSKNMLETNAIYLKSKDELERSNMWKFMKENVLHRL